MPKLCFAEKTVAEEEEEQRKKKIEEEEIEGEEEEEEEIYDDGDDDEMEDEETYDDDDGDEIYDDDDDLILDEEHIEAALNREIEKERKELIKKGLNKAKGDDKEKEEEEKKKAKKVVKPISKKELEKYNKEQDQHGVIYLCRIPIGMTPQKVKRIMSEFGKIERVYLTPESNEKRKIRKKEHGGFGGKRFTNGWVEFCDKRIAKSVAFSLNGAPVGGKKRSISSQELWLIKYLPKFKWSDLTEKLAQESEMRHQRLGVALARAKRQNELVLQRMTEAKGKEIYERKKREKLERKARIEKLEKKIKESTGGGGGDGSKKKSNPNFRHL